MHVEFFPSRMILKIQFELFQGLSNKSSVIKVFIDTEYFFVFMKKWRWQWCKWQKSLVTLWWLYDNSRIIMLVSFLCNNWLLTTCHQHPSPISIWSEMTEIGKLISCMLMTTNIPTVTKICEPNMSTNRYTANGLFVNRSQQIVKWSQQTVKWSQQTVNRSQQDHFTAHCETTIYHFWYKL